MATRRKDEKKTTEKKHEPIEIRTAADVSIKNVPEQKDQEKPLIFPVVGIGASAGGLAAFEAFFAGMPADKDPDMAFVLVQHLAPDHGSILTEIIRRYTRMTVFEVKDGMVVKPNCVYIIPPNYDMALLNGALHLMEPTMPRGQRLPIDYLFRSMADDQHERAICIILSGTGSDGTLGLRAIKGEGGMAIAQRPDTTEYDGMPNSAIMTGLVDYQLPPIEMAKQVISYVAHAFGNLSTRPAVSSTPLLENALQKIFILLRSQTGHDFSQYKMSTIQRRIERRMTVQQIDTLDAYIKYMQQTPVEAEALFRNFLIGVTKFFRDTEAFQVLEEQVIPKLFADKSEDAVIRVWCPGCSTGEEAYSIAIMLMEHIIELKQRFSVQIFATDIDNSAIGTARAGLCSASIVSDISPERLARFFTVESGKSVYRIHKSIRDMILFSVQNVISDPPFSKLDLISCRNLMIYLNGDLQKKLLSLFHYALNPLGILFLGASETTGESGDLFAVLNSKSKLYQRKENFYTAQYLPRGRFIPPMAAQTDRTSQRIAEKHALPVKLPLQELTERALLQKVTPAGALVNSKGDILYMHGRTGMYLELGSGEIGFPNIVNMAREGLRRKLATALQKAAVTKEIVSYPGLHIKTNDHFTCVNLSIHRVETGNMTLPVTLLEESLFLVVLEEAPQMESADTISLTAAADSSVEADARITTLKKELKDQEESLQSANEALDSSTEKLKSSNEELQSVNEELQSANEELETSKEELQSINEELLTVNAEMQTNVEELSRSNNDMNNLLSGTGIGTVFVDHQQHIMRYTPAASAIINLIESDTGRLLAHVVSNLVGYDRLNADIQSVLDTLVSKEVEVKTETGQWYLMHILPYRTMNNVIEGAVITFVDITEQKKQYVDITELKKVQAALQESQERFKKLFVEAPLGIALIDSLTGHIYEVNPMFTKIVGRTMEEMAHIDWMSITHMDDVQEDLDNMARLNAGEINGFQRETRYLHRDGASVWINMTIATVLVEDKTHPCHLCMIEDITERKRTEATLRQANELLRLAVVVRDAYDAITVQDLDGRIIAWNPCAVRMYGWSEAEALSMNVSTRISENRVKEEAAVMRRLALSEILKPYHTRRLAKDGTEVDIWMTATALVSETGQMYAIATTERKVEGIPNQAEGVQNG